MEMEEAKSLVQSSWAKAAGAVGVEGAGKAFFSRIFTSCPAALNLYHSFKGDDGWEDSEAFTAHCVAVITTVDAAVKGLDDLDALVPVLQDLGKRHAAYHVTPEHFDVVGGALLWTLESALKEEFTDKIKQAWTQVWEIIVSVMKPELLGGWKQVGESLDLEFAEGLRG